MSIKLNQLIALILLSGLWTACADSAENNPFAQDKKQEEEKPKNTVCSQNDWARGTIKNDETDNLNCTDYFKENLCLRYKDGFQWALKSENQSLFDSCLTFPSKNYTQVETLSTPPPYILLNVSKKEKLQFAQWADQKNDLLKNIRIWPTANYFGEIYTVGSKSDRQLILGILDPQLMPNQTVWYLTWPLAPRYFIDVTDFITYIENPMNPETQREFKTEQAEIKSLLDLNSQTSGSTVQSIESYSSTQCNQTCIRSYQEIQVGDNKAIFREHISYGHIYRTEWLLKDERQNVIAMLYLNGRQPSLAVSIQRDQTGRATEITVRDRLGETLPPIKYKEVTEDIQSEHIELARFKTQHLTAVGLCEDEVSYPALQALLLGHKILTGPHKNLSFYGWSDNSTTKNMYWSGREHANSIGLKLSTENLSEHATHTFQILANNKDIGVIPLSADSCLNTEEVATWWPAFIQRGARVINYSASSMEDKTVCERKMQKHPLVQQPNAALWVVAAGNRGESRPVYCPQHLSGRENIIIVGASEGHYRHSKSNYGYNFVDIFAPGEGGPQNKAWGTSFAAPRVSQVAARILAKYKQLTPAQARLCILLSADIPSQELPARSRGILNGRKAMEMADSLTRNQNNMKQTLIEIYDEFLSSEELKRRESIYTELMKGH